MPASFLICKSHKGPAELLFCGVGVRGWKATVFHLDSASGKAPLLFFVGLLVLCA